MYGFYYLCRNHGNIWPKLYKYLLNSIDKNKNRMIRRYFKKGKLVEDLSDEIFENNLKKKGIDTSFLDVYRIKLPKCLVA